jgi:transcription antitermination factor NusG
VPTAGSPLYHQVKIQARRIFDLPIFAYSGDTGIFSLSHQDCLLLIASMPILTKEPDMYPANLFEQPLPQVDESWYAMYTIARHEKELMRKLRPLNIAHYGPLIPQRKRSPQGRIRTSYVPLFSGYVFIRGDNDARYQAVSTGCVSRCLLVKEIEQLTDDLRRIHQLVQVGQDVRPEPKPLLGRTAMVKRGAMTGLKGTITKVHDQHRLTVIVNFMQKGASILVDEADVELL